MSSYRDKVAAWTRVDISDTPREKTAVEGLEAGGLLMSGPANKAVFLGATKAIDVANPVVDTLGYKWNRMLNRGVGGLLDRVKADEVFAGSLVKGLSERTFDIAESAISSVMKKLHEKNVASPTRHAILKQLKKEDDIIGLAPQKSLLEAYHTMKNFAPTLSTDKNAVKSFLRQAVQHDGGVDFMSIKGLADAEAAVTGRSYKGGA